MEADFPYLDKGNETIKIATTIVSLKYLVWPAVTFEDCSQLLKLQRPEQPGFTSGKSLNDFVLHPLVECWQEFWLGLHVPIVDLEKVFESVHHESTLWPPATPWDSCKGYWYVKWPMIWNWVLYCVMQRHNPTFSCEQGSEAGMFPCRITSVLPKELMGYLIGVSWSGTTHSWFGQCLIMAPFLAHTVPAVLTIELLSEFPQSRVLGQLVGCLRPLCNYWKISSCSRTLTQILQFTASTCKPFSHA